MGWTLCQHSWLELRVREIPAVDAVLRLLLENYVDEELLGRTLFHHRHGVSHLQ